MKFAMAVILFTLLLAVGPASAATYYVGFCHAGSFATISAAVSSPSVAPGSTVRVCPGTYLEQVVIAKPLTLIGVASAGSDAAIITGSTADATVISQEAAEAEIAKLP